MAAKYLILAARFNEFITKQLHEGAVSALKEQGLADRDIETIWVPGCFELPTLAGKAARSQKFSAVICLGAVIRGETPHFDYVAGQTAAGILRAGYDTGTPVVFGVLTTDTIEQAIARTGIKFTNKGREAAATAIDMIAAGRKLEEMIKA